ncbi:MAG: hypothetical protein UHD09_04195 [Bifidobacterium sp.]|nr:hypothetical protein [Bifidobacterium sp.]
MASEARSPRANAAPAGRKANATRPQLHVVEKRTVKRTGQRDSLKRVWAWTKTRTTPLMAIGASIAFLVVCLLVSLLLRTQMSSNSFEASDIEQHITMLQQDVDDDQAKLSQLEATLPERAQKMKMVPAQGNLSIDLKGYQPSQSTTKGTTASQGES